jgi:site-specific recombinase XerC
MTDIAPHMTAYLRQRLPVERAASQHTCDTYAYAFQLLLHFASQKLSAPPSALQLDLSTLMPHWCSSSWSICNVSEATHRARAMRG